MDMDMDTHPPAPLAGGDAGAGGQKNGFEKFWEIYPRHQARREAELVWQAISPDEALTARIHAAVEAQRRSAAWQRENGRYVPMAAVWLEGERWNDEVQEAAAVTAADVYGGGTGVNENSSFDTDDFFEAALRRSYSGETP